MMIRENANAKKIMVVSLFWGALWGITEATLGYLAHLVLFIPAIAGFIMFPIGFYFMNRAYKEIKKNGAIFGTAAVAASIKLVDLLLPGLHPIKTINPAISILMEALVVLLVLKVMIPNADYGTARFRFREAFTAAVVWRMGFILYSLLLFSLSIYREFFQMEAVHLLRFLLLESVINGVIIAVYLKAESAFNRNRSWSFSPASGARTVIAAALFTAAILVKLILA